jgi:hypothetical protein
MIDWVVTTMRNDKVATETANLNGFVYDASFQLHHKKPGTSVMQHDLKKVGGGGKTAQKPTPSAAPPLCNICGGNHTIATLENYVKQGEQAKKKARNSTASSGSSK